MWAVPYSNLSSWSQASLYLCVPANKEEMIEHHQYWTGNDIQWLVTLTNGVMDIICLLIEIQKTLYKVIMPYTKI